MPTLTERCRFSALGSYVASYQLSLPLRPKATDVYVQRLNSVFDAAAVCILQIDVGEQGDSSSASHRVTSRSLEYL